MSAWRLHLRPLSWLALAAVLALALLPTLSHALAFARGSGGTWAEVCTPQGLRLVAPDAAARDGTPAPLQAGVHLEHCPLCALHGLDAAPPPVPVRVLPMLSLAQAPALFFSAPYTLPAWRSAQPRGPPHLS